MYVERMRAQTLHAYSQLNAAIGGRRGGGNGNASFSGADMATRSEGTDTVLRGVLVGDGPSRLDTELARAAELARPPPPCPLLSIVLLATDTLLAYYSSINMPPTRCARGVYLYFLGLAGAYNWCSEPVAVTGVKDGWNWVTKYVLDSDSDQVVFVTQCLHRVLSSQIPSYSNSTLDNILSPAQRDSATRVQEQAQFVGWAAAWDSWLAGRAADGSVAAAVFPAPSELPNGATFLETTQQQNFADSAAYPNPTQWTPLSISGVQKKYLTMNWNSVTSTALTDAQEASCKTAAAAFKLTGAARESEVGTLFALTQALTDEQKVIAEFWAGGPGTPSPPGIAIWLWRVSVEALRTNSYAAIYSGLDLAITLFESSRLIWGLKAQFKEARPIQEIRRFYAGQTAMRYDGAIVPAALWVPFQETNFVTPPFPDFPSGHSGFSQSLANVMTRWFGTDIPDAVVNVQNANTVTPLLPAGAAISLRRFTIAAGTSEIQRGVVPAAPVTLNFTTWQSMAESAGISRQYGGIHCVSAHTGGQTVANTLYPFLQSAWAIRTA